MQQSETPFKWRHFQTDIILLCVRWYLRYSLSYRELEEMMAERGLQVDHSMIARWVVTYAGELEQRIRPHLKPGNDSWRVDETYIKVRSCSRSQKLVLNRLILSYLVCLLYQNHGQKA